jgi:two-component system NarL family sensor kinase
MLAGVRQLVQRLYDDLRNLSHDLRPVVLDTLGLPAALRELAGHASSNGLSVEVAVEPPHFPALPEDVAIALYRVAQAAMTNVVRHAGASHARLSLERPDGAVRLSVGDDGRGFDPGTIDASSGLGLVGMRERAAWLGGNFDIQAVPGGGCRVEVRIPIRQGEP